MVTPWTGRVEFLHRFWSRPQVPEYRAEMKDLICDFLAEDDNCTVLDAGCGTGITYSLLPPWAQERYTGIDFTEEMVEYCRAQHPGGDFRHTDVLLSETIPDADLVITQNVLQHIEPWQVAAYNLVLRARRGVIFCERSHKTGTRVNMWKPVLSWAFNEEHILRFLRSVSEPAWGKEAEPRILSRPRDTEHRRGVLTIYMMRRP